MDRLPTMSTPSAQTTVIKPRSHRKKRRRPAEIRTHATPPFAPSADRFGCSRSRSVFDGVQKHHDFQATKLRFKPFESPEAPQVSHYRVVHTITSHVRLGGFAGPERETGISTRGTDEVSHGESRAALNTPKGRVENGFNLDEISDQGIGLFI